MASLVTVEKQVFAALAMVRQSRLSFSRAPAITVRLAESGITLTSSPQNPFLPCLVPPPRWPPPLPDQAQWSTCADGWPALGAPAAPALRLPARSQRAREHHTQGAPATISGVLHISRSASSRPRGSLCARHMFPCLAHPPTHSVRALHRPLLPPPSQFRAPTRAACSDTLLPRRPEARIPLLFSSCRQGFAHAAPADGNI